MTLAQFDALSPTERDYWIADWQIGREECDCGRLVEECSDPTRKFYPYRRICYATMEREAAAAALNDLRGEDAQFHNGTFTDWAKVRSASHPYPAGAGEAIGVADQDIAPWDKFTTERDSSPFEPQSQSSDD